MRLVEEWKKFYRMASVQCMSLAIAVQTTWELIPADLKANIPQKWVYGVTMSLLVFGIVGRLVQQPKVHE